jgi:oxalate decarboxylase/phosphoglucose isomerase-like protein (cupin superfamily)
VRAWPDEAKTVIRPSPSKSGTVRITDSNNFPASKTIAAALVMIEPGGLRELHWHPNADEWQYYIAKGCVGHTTYVVDVVGTSAGGNRNGRVSGVH